MFDFRIKIRECNNCKHQRLHLNVYLDVLYETKYAKILLENVPGYKSFCCCEPIFDEEHVIGKKNICGYIKPDLNFLKKNTKFAKGTIVRSNLIRIRKRISTIHFLSKGNKLFEKLHHDFENKLLKSFNIHRDYVRHEDALINQRITWLLSINGFLFAALAIVFQSYRATCNSVSANCITPNSLKDIHFMMILTVVGILMNLVAFLGIHAAVISILYWHDHWNMILDKYRNPYIYLDSEIAYYNLTVRKNNSVSLGKIKKVQASGYIYQTQFSDVPIIRFIAKAIDYLPLANQLSLIYSYLIPAVLFVAWFLLQHFVKSL